jgi:hypothetical protein
MSAYNEDIPADENKGPSFLVLTCVLTSCSIIATCTRLWVRRANRALGWDDYTLAAVLLLSIGRTGVQIDSVLNGNGRHKAYLSIEDYRYVNKLTWVTQILLFITMPLLKTSIGLLLLRIKRTRPILYTMIGLFVGLVLTNGLPIIVLLAECSPVSQYWHQQPGGKCWNPKVRIYSIYAQVGMYLILIMSKALL